MKSAAGREVVPARVIRLRDDPADVVGAAQRIRRAADREHLVAIGVFIAAVADVARVIVERVQDAEGGLADRARQLVAEDRIDDAAGVDRGAHVVAARDVEEAHAFHEERPLLGEEDRESLIDRDLEGIALDLAEVGIDRGVERHARRDAELAAGADVRVVIGGAPRRRRRLALLPHAVGHARQHFNEAARLQVAEDNVRRTIEHPLARQHLRPRVRHAGAADLAEEHQAHAHRVAALEAQCLQRHLDLDDVAIARRLRDAVPHDVRIELLAGCRGVDRVHLAAARIREEVIRRLAGARRIEAHRDPVVAERAVAAADVGADLVGLVVEAVEGEVDVAIVVADADFGAEILRHLVAADRLVRHPLIRRHRQRRDLPGFVVEDAVDLRRLREARDGNIVRGLGGRRRGHRQGEQGDGEDSRHCFNGPSGLGAHLLSTE